MSLEMRPKRFGTFEKRALGGAVGYRRTEFFPNNMPKYFKIVKHYPARRAASTEK